MSEGLISTAKVVYFFEVSNFFAKKNAQMTSEQFKKLLKKKQKEINQAFSRTLPVKVGTEAVKCLLVWIVWIAHYRQYSCQ